MIYRYNKPELLMFGDAKGGIKLTTTPKNSTRAQAYIKQLQIKEAGGQYIGNTGLTQFVKDLNQVPQDVITTVAQYTTTPGLVYTVWNEGKKTKTQIETRMATDPQFKSDVENVVQKIKTTGSDILSTVTDPIVSTSRLITWLPYMLVGGLVIAAFYVVKNPGSIATPRKISLM